MSESDVCNQEWIDIDEESHRCVKSPSHRDGQHQDRAGNVWPQRWLKVDNA